jgi:hypothetical protein
VPHPVWPEEAKKAYWRLYALKKNPFPVGAGLRACPDAGTTGCCPYKCTAQEETASWRQSIADRSPLGDLVRCPIRCRRRTGRIQQKMLCVASGSSSARNAKKSTRASSVTLHRRRFTINPGSSAGWCGFHRSLHRGSNSSAGGRRPHAGTHPAVRGFRRGRPPCLPSHRGLPLRPNQDALATAEATISPR